MTVLGRFKYFPLTHLLGVGALVVSITAIAFWPTSDSISSSETNFILDVTETKALIELGPVSPTPEWHKSTVSAGDSLSVIFNRYNLGAATLHTLVQSAPKEALRIQPGQSLRWTLDDEQQLEQFIIDLSALAYDRFERQEDGSFSHQRIVREAEHHPKVAQVTINNSLFLDGMRANIPEQTLIELANIFGWDIDFALDIRQGDRFTVVYDELYLDGEHIGYGNILTAKFINRGRELAAVRYTNAEGKSDYYTPEGRSMRKEFLRNPIDYFRISSRFSTSRKHPVLQTIRAHRGTDYAAPTGTPIKASGDGKVIFAGRQGGYGNTIILQHGQSYTTLYAHLSRFHKNTKSGRYVKQGQVIGYVGMTGLASGPHLHYEFRVNGVHRDPLTVKLPQAQSIAANQLDDFKDKTSGLLAWLSTYDDNTIIASSDFQ